MKFSKITVLSFLSAFGPVEGHPERQHAGSDTRIGRKNSFRERFLQSQTDTIPPPSDTYSSTDANESAVQGPLEIRLGVVDQIFSSNISTAIQLWMNGINEAGGIKAGNTTYPVKVVTVEVQDEAKEAVNATKKLVSEDEVFAIVGPNWSSLAIPSGEVAESSKTPLISPTSTNPSTTFERPYVFRASFLDSLQGMVLAKFVTEQFNFTKAAILYDEEDAYPSGLANFFKQAWEEMHGPGSVVVEETFTGEPTTAVKDLDFAPQLQSILDSEAELFFLPQYVSETATIVNMVEDMGWNRTIVGGDAWAGAEEGGLFAACGDACLGHFFVAPFIPHETTGHGKDFVQVFDKTYGYLPGDAAALAMDSISLVENAVQRCADTGRGLTGNVVSDRECIREALAKTKDYVGVTGNFTFNEHGDPMKCMNIAYLNNEGDITLFEVACP